MQFVIYDREDKTKIYGVDRVTGQLKRKEYQKNTLGWDAAESFCKQYPQYAPGLYVNPPQIFIDLDGVIDGKGYLHPTAQEILGAIPLTAYVEYSMSRRGLHIIVQGAFDRKPVDHLLDNEFWGDNDKKKPSLEIYGQKRYCALTFDFFPGFGEKLTELPTLDWTTLPYIEPFLPPQEATKKVENGVAVSFYDNGSRHNELVRLNRAIYSEDMTLTDFTDKLLETAKRNMPEADFSVFLDKRNYEVISLYEGCKKNWVPQLREKQSLLLYDDDAPELPETPQSNEEEPPARRLSYKINANLVAEAFIEKHRCFTKSGKKFTVWNGTHWIVDEEPSYLARCIETFIFQEKYNIDLVKGRVVDIHCLKTRDLMEVFEHVKRQCIVRVLHNPKPNTWFDAERRKQWPYVVAVQNGLLSITEGKIISPFTVDFYNTGMLPCDWNESATAPRFLDGLHTIFAGEHTEEEKQDNIDCLQLWFGYLFLVGYSEKKLCVLLGDSNSGKSTLMRVMETLIGEQYFKALALRDLDGNRTDSGVGFDTHILGGFDEFPFDKKLGGISDMIKMYTGDTKISQRGLYKEGQTVEMLMKLVLTSNTSPTFLSDPMGGLMNRMLIWNCRAVPKEQQDPNYLKYLKENELPGILRWALVGAQRILAGVRLRQPGGESGALYQEFKDSTLSQLAQWIGDVLEESEDGSVTNDELFERLTLDRMKGQYRALSITLDSENLSPKTIKTRILREIRNTVFPNVRKYKNCGVLGVRGVIFRKTGLSSYE